MSSSSSSAIYLNKLNQLCLSVSAKPGAKTSEIIDFDPNDSVVIKIGAAPVDGAANKELCSFVANFLNLKKNDVTLDVVRQYFLYSNHFYFNHEL
jgi:uncharacterized protein YggU (UPF0235/DUF167 family)